LPPNRPKHFDVNPPKRPPPGPKPKIMAEAPPPRQPRDPACPIIGTD
jgi:hypothetical protein